jgi:hypothetical protein
MIRFNAPASNKRPASISRRYPPDWKPNTRSS